MATLELTADCSRCVGLCCVVPAFVASAEFAVDKPAGTTCPNLGADFRCTIHAELRESGFAGCNTFDCYGAGQRVTRRSGAGPGWRQDPHVARQVLGAFPAVRTLHELLRHLATALALVPPGALHTELNGARRATERLADGTPDSLAALDVNAHWQDVNALLTRASESLRGGSTGSGANHRGADLIRADLIRADLRRANLRGTHLIGADLRGTDLDRADVTGADLRGALLNGADLTGCLFLVQPQLESARGDATTLLPADLHHPTHWANAG